MQSQPPHISARDASRDPAHGVVVPYLGNTQFWCGPFRLRVVPNYWCQEISGRAELLGKMSGLHGMDTGFAARMRARDYGEQ